MGDAQSENGTERVDAIDGKRFCSKKIGFIRRNYE